MRYFTTCAIGVLFFSCSDSGHEEPVEEIPFSKDSTISEEILQDTLVIDSATLNLISLLDSPLNFSRVKEEFHLLEMGTILPKKYMRPIDSTLHNYNYGANAALLRYGKGRQDFTPPLDELQDAGRLVSFSTYKPWGTAEEKYYETDNELLVGVESRINHPALEPLNFVGTKLIDIHHQFGQEWRIKGPCHLYFNKNKILVLHNSKGRIDWFKYYWLNSSIQKMNDLPDELFVWKNR